MLAPEVFQADEAGQGVVVMAEVQGELENKALLAEQNCPEKAILCVTWEVE
jgi:ferredoxin